MRIYDYILLKVDVFVYRLLLGNVEGRVQHNTGESILFDHLIKSCTISWGTVVDHDPGIFFASLINGGTNLS